jgi:diacylglycerol O-acyltransferase
MARRLSALDIAFLQMETPEAPSHVGGLQIFQIPADYKGSFVADLKARLQAIPASEPFNTRLGHKGLPFAFPAWVTDKNFDIDFHLRHSALPQPGHMDELMKLVSRLHGRLLDRTRPLWEMYLIEGLEGDRFGIYTKIHHALVDGVGGMRLMDNSLARSADDADTRALWSAAEIEKRERLKLSMAAGALKTAKGLFAPVRALPQAVKALILPGDTEAAIAFKTSKTVFNGHITASRRFAIQTLPLAQTKEIGAVLGHTVNDMFLAICATALRRYLADKGQTPAHSLTATVPVSLQLPGSTKQGNQISYIGVNLCTDIEDPIERMAAIGRSAAAAKRDMGALSRPAVQTLAVVAQGTAALINHFHLSSILKPPANLVLSNVPGPRSALYLMGAEMVGSFPMSMLMDGQALNITLCSHGNQLDFGILGCRNAMPDIELLAQYVGDAFEELRAIAATGTPAAKAAPNVQKVPKGKQAARTKTKATPKAARPAVRTKRVPAAMAQ